MRIASDNLRQLQPNPEPEKRVNWETAKECLGEIQKLAPAILDQGLVIGGVACWFYRHLLSLAGDADFKVPPLQDKNKPSKFLLEIRDRAVEIVDDLRVHNRVEHLAKKHAPRLSPAERTLLARFNFKQAIAAPDTGSS